jgi:hypothetical protein
MKKLLLSAVAILALNSVVNAQDDSKKKLTPEKKTEKSNAVNADGTPASSPSSSSKMAINEKPVDTRPKKGNSAALIAPKNEESKKDELKKDKNN